MFYNSIHACIHEQLLSSLVNNRLSAYTRVIIDGWQNVISIKCNIPSCWVDITQIMRAHKQTNKQNIPVKIKIRLIWRVEGMSVAALMAHSTYDQRLLCQTPNYAKASKSPQTIKIFHYEGKKYPFIHARLRNKRSHLNYHVTLNDIQQSKCAAILEILTSVSITHYLAVITTILRIKCYQF